VLVASLLWAGWPSAGLSTPGGLDLTFGTQGRVTTDLGGGDVVSALVRQPDGHLVATGWSVEFDAYPSHFGLARYTPDGTPDPTFGSRGVATAASWLSLRSLLLQPDGYLIAASSYGGDFALLRVDTVDGCVGAGAFHIHGRITTESGEGETDVPVRLSGAEACRETTLSRALGRYDFSNPHDGLYTVTPHHAACTFRPASQTVTMAGGHVRVAFTAACP
jgi:hypothetical protein